MRDKYERRHRRTAGNPESMAMMAGANFDSLPSLAEAMGLEEAQPVATHTHTGHVHPDDYASRGSRGSIARTLRGATHALNGTPTPYSGAIYTALCGERVRANLDAEPGNVRRAGERPVTCERCQRSMGE
jgi:hypothetical protein